MGSTRAFHASALLLASGTLVSQLLAVVRDRLLAGTFGLGPELDLYYTAFRVPDLLFATFGSLLAMTVVIPYLHRSREPERFAGELLSAFLLLIGIGAALAFALMPRLAPFVAPGFDAGQLADLVRLARLLLLSPILLGLSNHAASMLQARHSFASYAFAPVAYNLGIIAGIVLLAPTFGIQGVVYGVLLGALAHFLVQFGALARAGALPVPHWPHDWRTLGTLAATSVPRTFALTSSQFLFLALVAFASRIGTGAVSTFTFAYNLQAVPVALIGVSYGMASFPSLSSLAAAGSRREFSHLFRRLLVLLSMVALCASILFALLRTEAVRLLFGTGAFGSLEIALVAGLLLPFLAGLVPQVLIALAARAAFADGKTWLPSLAAFLGALTGGWLGALALREFALGAAAPDVVLGRLALAYTAAMWVNGLLLVVPLLRHHASADS